MSAQAMVFVLGQLDKAPCLVLIAGPLLHDGEVAARQYQRLTFMLRKWREEVLFLLSWGRRNRAGDAR